ncbi:MAG: hypothetical protein AB3N63_09050 [Puniceicoccaceae bacterium]
MPTVKDITKDIGKLSKRNALPTGEAPAVAQVFNLERKTVFNSSSFLFWTLIFFFLALQVLFLSWLALS